VNKAHVSAARPCLPHSPEALLPNVTVCEPPTAHDQKHQMEGDGSTHHESRPARAKLRPGKHHRHTTQARSCPDSGTQTRLRAPPVPHSPPVSSASGESQPRSADTADCHDSAWSPSTLARLPPHSPIRSALQERRQLFDYDSSLEPSWNECILYASELRHRSVCDRDAVQYRSRGLVL
jgi:hypothetical protein